MKKIKYLYKRLLSMNYGQMFNTAKKINRKTNRPYIIVLADIVWCGLKYGAGYVDYDVFEMYKLNGKQRKTYVTRGKNCEIVAKCNDKSKMHIIDNKIEFNKLYNKYLNRDWIYITESSKDVVTSWITKHEVFIAKNITGTCGKEVKKINTREYKTLEELYNYLVENNYMLLEEYVIQHKDLMKLYPDAVNTVRFVTFLKDNNVHIIMAFLRIGNGGFVDNLNSGGLAVPVNIKIGIIEDLATDKEGNVYEKHPITKTKIKGFKIPYWKEAIKMVNEASHILPQVRYVGWDVAITDKGPVFIEGNPFPGHDIYQLPIHVKNKTGLMVKFNKIKWKE